MAVRRFRVSREPADGSPTHASRRLGAGASGGGRRGWLPLGALLLLLAAGSVGMQSWLLAVQLEWLRTLGATVQGLQDRLAELSEENHSLGVLQQELAELRMAQAQLGLKVREAPGVAEQMLAKAPPERLGQVLWAGVEPPGQLVVLQERLACLEEGPKRLFRLELDWAKVSGSRLERFLESLEARFQKTLGMLQPLGRKVQEAQEASQRLEHRLGVINQRTLEIERSLGQLGQLFQALQLQLDRSQQELGEVKESVVELTSGGSTMQQLENIWLLLRELQAKKLAKEQQTQHTLQSLWEQSANLGNWAASLETSLTAICDLLTQVEASMPQLASTTKDRLRALRLRLEQVAGSRSSGVQRRGAQEPLSSMQRGARDGQEKAQSPPLSPWCQPACHPRHDHQVQSGGPPEGQGWVQRTRPGIVLCSLKTWTVVSHQGTGDGFGQGAVDRAGGRGNLG